MILRVASKESKDNKFISPVVTGGFFYPVVHGKSNVLANCDKNNFDNELKYFETNP